MASIEPRIPKTARLSVKGWIILAIGLFWAGLTGLFLGSPRTPGLNLAIALPVAVVYAGAVCRFRRPATGIAIGGTIAVNLVLAFLAPGAPIVNFLVAMTLSIDFWLFGELGIEIRKFLDRRRAFYRLAGAFAGALSVGWAIGVIFG